MHMWQDSVSMFLLNLKFQKLGLYHRVLSFLFPNCSNLFFLLADCKMVRAVCGCLNVKIHIRGELINSPQFHSDDLEFEESQDEFFQQVGLIIIDQFVALHLCFLCEMEIATNHFPC